MNLLSLCAADIQPSQELLSYCVAYLLNVKDWDFLSSVMNTGISGVVYVSHTVLSFQ